MAFAPAGTSSRSPGEGTPSPLRFATRSRSRSRDTRLGPPAPPAADSPRQFPKLPTSSRCLARTPSGTGTPRGPLMARNSIREVRNGIEEVAVAGGYRVVGRDHQLREGRQQDL